MIGVEGGARAHAASEILAARGFQTTRVPLMAVPQAIEVTARGTGRIDAVVLPSPLRLGLRPEESLKAASAIRSLDDRLTFRGGVRARTVPIVMHTEVLVDSELRAFGSPPPPHIPDMRWYTWAEDDLAEAIVEVIGEWRQSLLSELDYIGYTVSVDSAGNVSVSHALRRKQRESELLADETTPGALREAQYLILAEDFIDSFGRYDEVKFLIQNYEQIASQERIKPESVFQRFFEKHPELIQRDVFSHVWSKSTLRLS
jgi:hypothetical protein